MADFSGPILEAAKAAGAVVGAFVVAAVAVIARSILKRRVSADNTAMHAQGSERTQMDRLNAEIARRETERTNDYARWDAQLARLTERCEAQIAALMTRLDTMAEQRNTAVQARGGLEQQVHDLTRRNLELSADVERGDRMNAAQAVELDGLRLEVKALHAYRDFGRPPQAAIDVEPKKDNDDGKGSG